MVLLGSYMTNMAFNMQRMIPYMQRCGDLLQRESLLTNAEHRKQTQEMAIAIGAMMEELSRATGSVAHFYKHLEIGPSPGVCKIEPKKFDPMFKTIIDHTGAVNPQAREAAAREEVKEVPDYDEWFLEELADEFNMMEMMYIMKGNTQLVPGIAGRLRKAIVKYLKNETDTPANRKHLVNRTLNIIRKLIILPASLESAVDEEFDPNSLLDDLVTQDLPGILDFILDFKGQDQDFIKILKQRGSKICHKWVSELKDVFEGGLTHAYSFLKENIKIILTASCEPSKAKLVSSMGTEPICVFIETSYKDHESELAKQKPDVVMQTTPTATQVTPAQPI
jgi:hypothetical protein